jgi:hypothetical protein
MLDVKSILIEMGYTALKEDGLFWRTKPLYRDSKNPTSLRIRKNTGGFVDFSADLSGTLEDLVKLTTGKDIKLEDLQGDFEEIREAIKTTTGIKREWEGATLVKSYKFYLGRGISQETQDKFGARLCQSGKMTRRMVFPIFSEEGEIVGIDGRAIFDSNIKWKKVGYKMEWIFPRFAIPYILESGEVILVESIGDAMALWDAGIKNVLVIFGVKIFSKLISKIIELNPKKIIIATNNEPDNDMVGNDAAQKIGEKLLKFFDGSVIDIKLPPKKDFGEMTKTEINLWR